MSLLLEFAKLSLKHKIKMTLGGIFRLKELQRNDKSIKVNWKNISRRGL